MLSRLHIKLTAICSCITGVIVLILILVCLSVSERSMRQQEQSLFLMQANSISADLKSSSTMKLDWYLRKTDNGKNLLLIEVGGRPVTLSSLIMNEEEFELMDGAKEYFLEGGDSWTAESYTSKVSQQYFEYRQSDKNFLVMVAEIQTENGIIQSHYLYHLDALGQKISFQRFCFLFVWLLSTFVLFVFSYLFTSHVLKPVVLNQKKQKQFVALASHELRSPLAVFKTGLSILKSNPSEEKTERFHALISAEVVRMERLIDELLFLSKAENKSLRLQLDSVNMKELLASIYEKYLPVAEKKQIYIHFDEGKTGECYCICDRQRIHQGIVILLDNALSYTPPDGRITLELSASRTKCFIKIIDTGSGIADSEKDKIFDQFYQADASHNNKEHIGLGLSIAREICMAHDGEIIVSDTAGGGCTFTMKLSLR